MRVGSGALHAHAFPMHAPSGLCSAPALLTLPSFSRKPLQRLAPLAPVCGGVRHSAAQLPGSPCGVAGLPKAPLPWSRGWPCLLPSASDGAAALLCCRATEGAAQCAAPAAAAGPASPLPSKRLLIHPHILRRRWVAALRPGCGDRWTVQSDLLSRLLDWAREMGVGRACGNLKRLPAWLGGAGLWRRRGGAAHSSDRECASAQAASERASASSDRNLACAALLINCSGWRTRRAAPWLRPATYLDGLQIARPASSHLVNTWSKRSADYPPTDSQPRTRAHCINKLPDNSRVRPRRSWRLPGDAPARGSRQPGTPARRAERETGRAAAAAGALHGCGRGPYWVYTASSDPMGGRGSGLGRRRVLKVLLCCRLSGLVLGRRRPSARRPAPPRPSSALSPLRAVHLVVADRSVTLHAATDPRQQQKSFDHLGAGVRGRTHSPLQGSRHGRRRPGDGPGPGVRVPAPGGRH